MPIYNYTVHNAEGRIFKSCCEAKSESALRQHLKTMGYSVNSIAAKPASFFARRRKRIGSRDIVNMCRQFSIMYSSGLDLMDCLSLLAKETESTNLSEILQDIHDNISKGSNIGEAFGRHPNVFSPFFVNMIKAGEAAGKFDYVLGKLATYVEKQHELKKKIRGALAYPLMVVAMLLVVVTAMMIFVVPVFSEVYEKLGVKLPFPTLVLIWIADNIAYFILGIIVLPAFGWMVYKKTRDIVRVSNFFDKMKLRLPVYHKIVLLKFLQTLSLAVSAGTLLTDAIGISRDVADNNIASDAADMMEANIKRGGTVTDAIKLHEFFPQAVGHAFAAGEKSGDLAEMLSKFSIGIEHDVEDGIKKCVSTIEPMIIIILSMVVGFVMLAIYLPIFDIMKTMHG